MPPVSAGGMRDRAPSFPARRNSAIPHPASDPAQLYASLSANTRPWANRAATQFRMKSQSVRIGLGMLAVWRGLSPPRMAAHHGLRGISRGMRAGSAQDAGCVRDISKAGCMRAACWPTPVQTGGQGCPNASQRLSKWVSKRLSKAWTGGGGRRRRSRGASSAASC